jgi:hypothetical protein
MTGLVVAFALAYVLRIWSYAPHVCPMSPLLLIECSLLFVADVMMHVLCVLGAFGLSFYLSWLRHHFHSLICVVSVVGCGWVIAPREYNMLFRAGIEHCYSYSRSMLPFGDIGQRVQAILFAMMSNSLASLSFLFCSVFLSPSYRSS